MQKTMSWASAADAVHPRRHARRFPVFSSHHAGHRLARQRLLVQATTASPSRSAIPAQEKPPWAGGGPVTSLVNAAIGFKPLYGVMKVLAKRHLKGNSEKRGVHWDGNIQELQGKLQTLERLKDEVEDKSLHYPTDYPEYYRQEFHAYAEGNMEWMAAYEVEPATQCMYLNCWKQEKTLTWLEAEERMRGAIVDAIQDFQRQHGARAPQDILDVGCSVGVNSRFLAKRFPEASVVGLDLSPYFLAVAELREREAEAEIGDLHGRGRVRFLHALAEATGLPDASQDLVALQFVVHECPPAAIADFVREGFRILRPGGVLMISDNDPRSKVIQQLPPAIFTLMKSTEPHSDVYFTFDIEGCMADAGFSHVTTRQTDPRHRAIIAMRS